MKQITVYTDGACSGNPGDGGWACVLLYGEHRKELFGFVPDTTNNRMELSAAIYALQALKEPCTVDLYTDSTYLCHAFTMGWLENWKRNGWKTSGKKTVENMDLWETLLQCTAMHVVRFHKTKGHSNDALNNRCDQLARQAISDQRKSLTNDVVSGEVGEIDENP